MNKRTAVFIGLVLLIGVVLIVIGKVVQRSDSTSASYPAPASRINIEASSAKVRLVASPLPSIDLKQTNHFVLRSPEVKATFSEGKLDLKQDCATFNLGRCDSTFEIAVPPNVSVNVEGASVEAASLRSDLSVTNKGESFKGTELFGRVDVKTSSGSIEMKKLSALEYRAETTSGGVNVEASAQPNSVELITKSGNISARFPERPAPYKIDASSGTGKLTLDLKNTPDAQRTIRVQSQSGNINVAKTN